MEIDYCNYHFQSPATWYCRNCALHYGDCCIARAGAVKGAHCVSCARELESLGAANKVEPFWNVIHTFLAYPFKTGPLTLILLMSLLAKVAGVGGMMGLFIGLFILVVCTRYAYAIIEHTSMGKRTPPGLSTLLTRDPDNLFIKQIAVFFVAGLAMTLAARSGSTVLSLLVLAFVTLAMPASILVLAVEKELPAAVNPVLLTQIMTKMGLGYFVLYVFLNILSGGPYYVFQYFIDYIPESVYLPAFAGATIYFAFAAASMMGYALLQYQKELGYRAELEEDLTVDADVDADTGGKAQSLNELNILLIEGRHSEALARLKHLAELSPDDLQLQLRFHKLLAEMGVREELAARSNDLIEKLIATNAITSAAMVFLNTIKAVPEFKPASANSLLKLSDFFRERGQPRNALSMLTQLIKQHPGYEDMGKMYIKVARLYIEDLQQPDKAVPILNHIQKNPDYSETDKQEAAKLAKAL